MKNSKTVTFFEGLLVALAFSFGGSIVYFAFSGIFIEHTAVKLLITFLSLFYIIYLLGRSQETTGRFSIVLFWFVLTIPMWFTSPSIATYLLLQLLAIWIIRSIYFYSSLLPAITDFILTVISLITALWASSHTGSLFLSLWCFFLTQALFIYIPGRFKFLIKSKTSTIHSDIEFQRSYRAAEAAIIKLSGQQ